MYSRDFSPGYEASMDVLGALGRDDVVHVLERASGDDRLTTEEVEKDGFPGSKNSLRKAADDGINFLDTRPDPYNPKRQFYVLSDFGEEVFGLMNDYGEEVDEFEGFMDSFDSKRSPAYIVTLEEVEGGFRVNKEVADEIGCDEGTLYEYMEDLDDIGLLDFDERGRYQDGLVRGVSDDGRSVVKFVEDIRSSVHEEFLEDDSSEVWKLSG